MFSSLVAMAREGQPFSADRAQNQSINAFWLLNQIAKYVDWLIRKISQRKHGVPRLLHFRAWTRRDMGV